MNELTVETKPAVDGRVTLTFRLNNEGFIESYTMPVQRLRELLSKDFKDSEFLSITLSDEA